MAKKKTKQLKITQRRSLIDYPDKQRRTMQALGLRRINHSVIHVDSPQVRGMIAKVAHLVEVEEL